MDIWHKETTPGTTGARCTIRDGSGLFVAECIASDAAAIVEAPAMLAALRELMGYVGGWDSPADHPCGKAAAILTRIDGNPTAQPADPIPASYGIAAAPFAVFQIDAGTLTIERHDGPSPVRWAVDAARFAAAMQALTEGEG